MKEKSNTGRSRKYRYFVSDFETTVYKGQVNTEVWAAATVEMGTEDVKIYHSIGELYDFYKSLKCNVVAFFHNLKFDGNFWLSYLMVDLGLEQATIQKGEKETDVEFLDKKHMMNNTFAYTISDMGQWYTITIRTGGYFIEIRDSLKLLPFSVRKIGQGFRTKHQKLEMEYEGLRYAGCNITPEEQEYIANDVLVVKEALEVMFAEGHNKLTIGACCLSEFKHMWYGEYNVMFPNLYDIEIDPVVHGVSNAGEWIRKSYKGGWCYLAKGKENKIKRNGTTADVNSLYPSVMSSESGSIYPTGKPEFWVGEIPPEAKRDGIYYFVRIRTRFYLKKGKLPFIQIKGNILYKGTEALESSDVYVKHKDPKTGETTGKYYAYLRKDGEIQEQKVELTLTMTDYKLLLEHYDLVNCEILDGCWFYAQGGIFDEYINKYKEQKLKNTGALRELAKLFLNNLYGKMASSTNSSFKKAYIKDDKSIGFTIVPENDKTPGYIAVGSAITSYARNFTIRAAQMNYYGKNRRGFIYADTDSIHCDLRPDELKGIKVHDKNFCCWKLESCWDEAIFTRQKTYIEHVVMENLQPVEPHNNIRCAGMPDKCKDLFELSMTGIQDIRGKWNEEKQRWVEWNEAEMEFLFDEEGKPIKRDYSDFKVGLCVPGKLRPERIRGGVLLVETTYEMR